MSTRILLIAHAPLAQALRDCALHVFADCGEAVAALDVPPDAPPEVTLAEAQALLASWGEGEVLVLTDLFGATPSNVALRLIDGTSARMVAGVNLPMLLRALTYRNAPIDDLVARALAGGTQGVMQVGSTAPQTSPRPFRHDQKNHDHQQ